MNFNPQKRTRHQPTWDSEVMDPTGRIIRGSRQQLSSSSALSEEGSAEKRTEEYTSSHVSFASGTHSSKPSSFWSEVNSMQAVASAAHHHNSESSAAYFHWPPSSRLHGTAEERAAYFSGLQKDLHLSVPIQNLPTGQQASTLLDLMTIRAFHSKLLRQFSLGTAIGFRTRKGLLTDIPAIIVFVARKVHKEWLHELQLLPPILEGPGGIWCDVDVVEFSYYGTPAITPKEQVYTELVEGLRGNDACIGPGSQVASQETYGTLGAIVQSKTGPRQVGFLTNRHVAVDLDYPNQKMFHPLPPNLGPGVYLGAVERATSFITDDLWYGIFASMNPETFVRADGAFIPFGDCFEMTRVTTTVKGVGDMGDVMIIDLQAPVGSIVGRHVVKVGRSSGLTMGSIMAYALEYNDEKGICFFTDFLIVGESKQAFDLEGDSGSLILITEEGQRPRPVGIIWGGTANRGRLKLRNGNGPENWTSGVDLGRLLDLLQLSLITSSAGLADAVEEQRQWLIASSSQLEVSRRGGMGGLDQETGEASQFGGLPERDNPDTTPMTTNLQEMPITTLIASMAPLSNAAPARELELLDFGFVSTKDAPLQDTTNKESSASNTNAQELSFGFQLFDRHGKKRSSPES
ncbi:hypothetical protein GOP47_0003898 [Adiantum capillus-veneris]|uniref:Trypsin family protein n=1 Tax=Adiantum capillus-veneris TaxID=13818 RepID=A0A9D4V6H6_ADICA|nr:hypothetical protein GOP47_0003898 [Adiantum capillus-veneris]